MVDPVFVLLGISIILFIGFFAEFLFKKTRIPDVLILIFLGVLIGPLGLKYVNPEFIKDFAVIFTTFALVFLLYDGAFNISLTSLGRGTVKSLKITLFNFFSSVTVITLIMLLFQIDFLTSLLTGFILGGISSEFVIPLLKQMKVKGDIYSVLTLESAITDVLSIVSAFAILEIITTNTASLKLVLGKLVALFAVAGLVGIIAGVLWIIIVTKLFKENKSYMITIAYLLLVFSVTEFLQGNGALAALFFGLILRNSNELMGIYSAMINKDVAAIQKKKLKDGTQSYGVSVTSENERFFYDQITFVLKAFFFVYVGILFSVSNSLILIISILLALGIMGARYLSKYITREFTADESELIQSTFGRGLAGAAIAQIVILSNIPYADFISGITYSVIVLSIILSSIRIFMIKRQFLVIRKLINI